MTPNRWQQIEEIFQAALDLAPAERGRFIETRSAGDADLKSEVEKLLADFDSAEDFIESPAWTDSVFLNSAAKDAIEDSLEKQAPAKKRGGSDAAGAQVGRRIGAYELEKEIGRGGMGAVYLAERADGEFRQKVAIKLIKRGMDTDFVLKRFRRERQILANLNHPNIVLLVDGGTTPDGLPYFVMDYVEGEPLRNYCDREKLGLRERLELFRQVCEAVNYAHQKKVVHRDLKPSNILVNQYGMPKLLDFGIAKLLDPDQGDLGDTLVPPTETHVRLMTPEYASPEQVTGGEITPASDIYALGVLLYELVAGKRPHKFPKRAPHEVARIICEDEPDRPSEAVRSPDAKEQPAEFREQVTAELDKIILKALRKDPAERYKTAADLSADLQRFLENRPVRAQFFPRVKKPRPVPLEERELSVAILPFKLFGAADKEPTGGGGAATPVSGGGDEYLGIGLADALVMRLSGVKRLIVRPTSSALRFGETIEPFQAGSELGVDFIVTGNIRRVGERFRVSVQLLKVADRATDWAETFDEKSSDVLELEDSISERIAVSLLPYLTGEERRQLEKRGTNSPDAYESFLRGRFNWSLQSEEGFARAINFYRRAVQFDPDYAQAYAAIAEYYIFLGIHCVIPFAEGALAAKEAAEKAVRLDPSIAEGYAALGFCILSFDLDWHKADGYFRRAVEVNPNSPTARFWRTAILAQSGRFDEALEQVRKLHELDPDSLLEMHMTGWFLYHARRYDDSLAAHRRLFEVEPNYAWGVQTYSWVLRRAGQFEEAIVQAEKAVRLTGGENPFYLTALAAAYAEAGERERAEGLLARLSEISKTRFVSDYMLSLVYCALGEKDRALDHLERSVSARDGWTNWIGVEPQFDLLRGDPRYAALLRRSGNPLADGPEKITTGGSPAAASVVSGGHQPTTGDGEKSIAVLPLKLFGAPTGGGAQEDEFLGIGLADALVTRLSNVRRLLVRPTSSVLPFVDAATNPFQAGRELGVDYVLDGNIRRSGDRIRVTVQLLTVGENSSRWAESFNEHFTDVLELEDSISEKVVRSLISRLTGEEQEQLSKRGTNSPAAYEAYLRGRYHWNQFTPETLLKAQKSFRRAIEIDPDYALAFVGLADFYIWANILGLIPSGEALPLAEDAALRAIALDGQLGEAYASLGLTQQNRYSWKQAEATYQKALELSPNYVHAHEWWAAQLVGHGKLAEGVREMRLAESLDPLSLRTKTLTAWTLYQARLYEDALEIARQVIDMDANYPQGYSQLGNNLLQLGRVEEAIASYRKFNQMIPDSALAKYPLCHTLVSGGRTGEARQVLEEVKALAREGYVKPYFLGMAHAALDERDEAFANFEKAFEEDDPWMLWFGTEPLLDRLRDDARFDDLLRRMNLPKTNQAKSRTPFASKEAEKENPTTIESAGDVSAKTTGGAFTTGGQDAVAILPLKVLGGANNGGGAPAAAGGADKSDEEFLGIGLTDTLIMKFSQLQRFPVRPTSSVMRFHGRDADPFEAGTELGVRYVLDGNIRRAGAKLRVTLRLLDVATRATVWAEQFNGAASDIFVLEDEISEQVAKSLLPQISTDDHKKLCKHGTENTEAYEYYLRGRFHWNQFSLEGFSQAFAFYQRAVEIAPDYALAYAGLADYYNWIGVYSLLPFAESSARAKENALKAISIDPALAEAYAALGLATITHDFHWTAAENHFWRALEINQNYVLGRVWYCYFLGVEGRFDEAFAQIDEARRLDAMTPIVTQTRNWTLYYARRYEESLAATEQLLAREPHYGLSHVFHSLVLSTLGRFDEAIAAAQKAERLLSRNPYTLLRLASAYAAAARRDEAHTLLAEIERMGRAGLYVSPYLTATVYVYLGDARRAFAELEKALSLRDARLLWLGVDPPFDPLRSDPRFNELLRQTNNPLAS